MVSSVVPSCASEPIGSVKLGSQGFERERHASGRRGVSSKPATIERHPRLVSTGHRG